MSQAARIPGGSFINPGNRDRERMIQFPLDGPATGPPVLQWMSLSKSVRRNRGACYKAMSGLGRGLRLGTLAAMKKERARRAMTKTILIGALLFATTAAAGGGGRVLASADVLTIRIVDHPELDTTTRVEPDGTINFPYIGRIQAAGRTEGDLARTVARRLVELKILAGP
jgi:hypothetical protein